MERIDQRAAKPQAGDQADAALLRFLAEQGYAYTILDAAEL